MEHYTNLFELVENPTATQHFLCPQIKKYAPQLSEHYLGPYFNALFYLFYSVYFKKRRVYLLWVVNWGVNCRAASEILIFYSTFDFCSTWWVDLIILTKVSILKTMMTWGSYTNLYFWVCKNCVKVVCVVRLITFLLRKQRKKTNEEWIRW